jgi:hypothetical protein
MPRQLRVVAYTRKSGARSAPWPTNAQRSCADVREDEREAQDVEKSEGAAAGSAGDAARCRGARLEAVPVEVPAALCGGAGAASTGGAAVKQRKQAKRRQQQALARMMAASERLGLYDAELEGQPIRGRPTARTRRAIADARSGGTTPVAIDEL